jgi:ketosteroid isomerase-like protein
MNTAQKLISLIIFFAVAATTHLSAQDSPEKGIRAVLDAQVQAWNAGNIDEFMRGYWESDSLRFASGGSIKRGWKTTFDRYKKSYPDKAAMGKLAFTDLEMTLLSSDAALVFGKWELTRAKDKPGGLFTLTFRKTAQGWKIIHDHTSSGN